MFTSYGHLTQADDIAPNSVVIIPLAAMESHGPHLPLSTDGISNVPRNLTRLKPLFTACQLSGLALRWST